MYAILKGIKGFPQVFGHLKQDNKHYMVMQLLGLTLKNLAKQGQQIDLADLGYQMVNILEKVHATGFVHCDVKPDNIARNPSHEEKAWTLFDFGLSNYLGFLNTSEATNVRAGSMLYMSVEMLEGYMAYSNDIKSLAYMLAFLSKRALPWSDFCKTKDRLPLHIFLDELLVLKKRQMNEVTKDLPQPLKTFVTVALEMKGDAVNYDSLRTIL